MHYINEKPPLKISIEQMKKLIVPKIPKKKDSVEILNELKKIEELIKTIKFIEIFFPTEYGKDGVEIVDTPGVNDIDQIREEITYKIIPSCDAAILLMDANQILTASEQKFLKEKIIKNDIKKIFFIINKIDEIDEIDRKKTIEYAKSTLSKIIDNPKVFPVSSRSGLEGKTENNIEMIKESQIDIFENELCHFLTHEKGKMILTNPYNRANRHLVELMNSIVSQKQLIKLPDKELDLKKKSFESIIKNIGLKRKVFDGNVNNFFQVLNNSVEKYIHQQINNLCLWLFEQIDAYDINKIDGLHDFIVKSISNYLKSLSENTYDYYSKELFKISKEISFKFNDLIKEINTFSKQDFLVEEIYIDEGFGFEIDSFFEGINCSNKQQVDKTTNGIGMLAGVGGIMFGPAGLIIAAIGGTILSAQVMDENNKKLKHDYKIKINSLKNELINGIIATINDSLDSNYRQIIHKVNTEYNCIIESIENSINTIVQQKKQEEFNIHKQHEIYEQKIFKLNQIKIKIKDNENYIIT